MPASAKPLRLLSPPGSRQDAESGATSRSRSSSKLPSRGEPDASRTRAMLFELLCSTPKFNQRVQNWEDRREKNEDTNRGPRNAGTPFQ